ncbi:hypothetical protein [Limnobacter parvus]|uniref:Uncharacterized protein n=1 Tax=Limnobacter parvus TaxID=2939690 RepID=A0ABT1XCU9_9BURK|nr:hypothetical protein [Limnobacter parvus]MCR2745085.1 hypothetical protein [Limnobacter parvus]
MPNSISTNHHTTIENTSARYTLNQLAHTLPKIAHRLGHLLYRSYKISPVQDNFRETHATTGTHQLKPITDWLLNDQGPSLSAQNELKKQLVLRSRLLGYEVENPLFVFANNRVQSETIALREGDPLIAKPLDDAKLVLADLYQKKYGIRIVVETHPMNKVQLAKKIKQECLRAKGMPVGLILRTTSQGQGESMGPGQSNYAGHVTPIVIQQFEKVINVVSLDSTLNPNTTLLGAMLRLSHQNMNIRMITLHKARQADHFSCHTDALQILKDLLVQQKSSSRCILDDLSAHHLADGDQITSAVNLLKIDLPLFLQKVNQRAEWPANGNQNDAQWLQAHLSPTQPGKYQTIEQHWQRYSRQPWENAGKLHNHFLAVKAFHNANKVLNHLESFESKVSRDKYLAKLRKTHT